MNLPQSLLTTAPTIDHLHDGMTRQVCEDAVTLAVKLCDAPYASLTLVDDSHLWFTANFGMATQNGAFPRQRSFTDLVLQHSGEITQVEDTAADLRFADHPLMKSHFNVRFCAGVPLMAGENMPLGVLFIFDKVPRRLTESQLEGLMLLGRQTSRVLSTQHYAERYIQHLLHTHDHEQSMAAASQDLKSVVDLSYRYRGVNSTYLRYWHRHREDIEGHTVAEVVGEEVFQKIIKPHLDRAIAKECVSYEATFDYPGMGPRYSRVTYMPAYDRAMQVTGVLVHVEDIDDLRQTEASLRRSVQMIEDKNIALQRFIQILSHDLREPVNTIVNFTGLMREAVADPNETARYVDFVHRSGLRLRTLLDDLMDYVNVERHSVGGHLVSLNDVIEEVKLDLYDALTRTGALLTIDHLPSVRGEHTLLRVLLQNLIVNAVKFVAVGVRPQVHIGVVSHEQHCELVVSDNGIGIEEEHREAVFDLFKRLHPRRQYEGTGLGLATCRRVAELHNGRIWITSNPAGGSRFHVLLPLYDTQGAR